MERNNRLIAIFVLLLSPALSYAFLCPTNFNQYYEGDTLDKVRQECGKPDKEETVEVKPIQPQEWVYFIPQTVANYNINPVQGTLRTSVSFDDKGKAINITVNGVGVGATTICGGSVQLGDDQKNIKTACGKPAYINKQQEEAPLPGSPAAEANKIVEFTYMSKPPVVLQFKEGRLTGKK